MKYYDNRDGYRLSVYVQITPRVEMDLDQIFWIHRLWVCYKIG